jgi:hypothetical protein
MPQMILAHPLNKTPLLKKLVLVAALLVLVETLS